MYQAIRFIAMEVTGILGVDPGNDTRRSRVPSWAVPWGIGGRYVSMRSIVSLLCLTRSVCVAKAFIRTLIQSDPYSRPSAREALSLPVSPLSHSSPASWQDTDPLSAVAIESLVIYGRQRPRTRPPTRSKRPGPNTCCTSTNSQARQSHRAAYIESGCRGDAGDGIGCWLVRQKERQRDKLWS